MAETRQVEPMQTCPREATVLEKSLPIELQISPPVVSTAFCNTVDGTLFVRSAKRDRDWELPSGRLERHETPRQTLNREVQEETGYAVEDASLLAVFVWHHEGSVTPVIQFVYETTLSSVQQSEPGPETAELCFTDSPPETLSYGDLGREVYSQSLSLSRCEA